MRITWKEAPHTSFYGFAGGLSLFSVSWRSRREDPSWVMSSQLPGHEGKRWKHDDREKLQATAEEVLAGWLERVNGGPVNEQPG